jgi:hypothetical protein
LTSTPCGLWQMRQCCFKIGRTCRLKLVGGVAAAWGRENMAAPRQANTRLATHTDAPPTPSLRPLSDKGFTPHSLDDAISTTDGWYRPNSNHAPASGSHRRGLAGGGRRTGLCPECCKSRPLSCVTASARIIFHAVFLRPGAVLRRSLSIPTQAHPSPPSP